MEKIVRKLIIKHHPPLKSAGNSMSPILLENDIVYYQKILFSKIKVNDLLVIQKNNQLISHRAIYKSKKYVITKGDYNLKSDGKIYSPQIIGKITKIKRNSQFLHPENLYLIQSTYYFNEIIKIKNELDKQSINYVFLKGLPLYLHFESNHPKRIYADCDVLISTDSWQKAQIILEKFGYKNIESSYSKLHKILKDKPTTVSYLKRIADFSVIFDIHFEVSFLMNQLGRLDVFYSQKYINDITRQFLREKLTVKIQNESFSILSSSNLIIYLALHFFHHNYQGIFRLELLDKVIQKTIPTPGSFTALHAPEAFIRLSENIKTYQLQNFVYPVFLLLEKYYDLKAPKVFLDSIKPDKRRLQYIKANILKTNIFDDEARIKAGITRFKNIFILSANPIWKKILIIFNIQVIYSFFWVIIFFLRRSFNKTLKSS